MMDVYSHHGELLEADVDSERAFLLMDGGQYYAVGSSRRVTALVHKGPPDQREIPDQAAMTARGSRKAHYLEALGTGKRLWSLKPQRQPWGSVAS